MIRRVIGFKIWYTSTTVVGKTYHDWVACQDNEIQIVMLYFENPAGGTPYRELALGTDYYALNEQLKLSYSNDLSQLHGHIKYGIWTSDERINELEQQAINDYAMGSLWIKPSAEKPSRGGA